MLQIVRYHLMCCGTVPRYTKIPDYAKCSDDDKDEAKNILVAATEAASMSFGRTENSANTDVSKAVSKANKITDVANATNNDGARIDILPPSPTNVSSFFDSAKTKFCESQEEDCELSSLGSETESESLGKKIILLAAANSVSWDWRFIKIFPNSYMLKSFDSGEMLGTFNLCLGPRTAIPAASLTTGMVLSSYGQRNFMRQGTPCKYLLK